MRWQRKGLTPAPGKERCLTKEKIAWASESLCLEWWAMLKVGVNQYPNHLTTSAGWKRWLSSSIRVFEGDVLGLGVSQ